MSGVSPQPVSSHQPVDDYDGNLRSPIAGYIVAFAFVFGGAAVGLIFVLYALFSGAGDEAAAPPKPAAITQPAEPAN